MASLTPEMLYGVLILVGILLLRFAIGVYNGWIKTENKVNAPLSITLKTGETPAEVYEKAQSARRWRHFAFLVIFFVGCYGFYVLDKELACTVFLAAVEFLVQAMVFLISVLEAFVDQLSQLGSS